MLFNSLEFLVFFPVVCILYFILPKTRWRNIFLLVASYYFYMSWKPVYALLILTSTLLTFGCGVFVEKYAHDDRRKKAFLVTSLVLNFAILFLFKYYNFIGNNITTILASCGLGWKVPNLDVLLPVGISFYTFQAVGYSIDVYRGTIKAEHDFFTYALFVSFFPQLVAGPIERAKNLLPQFGEDHRFDYDRLMAGLKLMLWGYFLKLCIADRFGIYVDAIFNNVDKHNGGSFFVASMMFPFQIYGDFCGYSLIAIGAAKVMGFRLMENFRRPYFSTSIGEFWKRWHISLSTWFMDYLYIPLGGNRVRKSRLYFNLFFTFLVSGIWHGANWTFVAWGALHGMLLCVEKALGISKKNYSGTKKLFHWLITFMLVCFAWIFFRANNIEDAFTIIGGIFTNPGTPKLEFANWFAAGIAFVIMVGKEVLEEKGSRLLHPHSWVIKHAYFVLMIAYIILFGVLGNDQFIYFQF